MSATAAPVFPNPLANAPVMMGAVPLGQTVGEFILENIAYRSGKVAEFLAEGDAANAERFLDILTEDLEQAHAVEIPEDMIAAAQNAYKG